ncbi:AbrB/MazE/SpoVT family DNA-binding domain-containing protein [Mangrovibacillus cuniculi]|uniref:AbrB/MazE/SpoVT family DNA-binding domain-containing protein n=1 Tax=Mangrovibacillus cuniculi TaxID=2593652 RepID=A0A7S8HG21_9BACI|nr:AbrB/MazE/SpoVT family DNA-binding domain-containing protein [Mangrovibacillus cuniculi]QPC47136.1 AbrB/MazE/SpoVT family DNA-binding domain-containing protein [Mangrovibacillus cuniculi]QPC48513.1 AbrB/MazE/SpoVT family DNA-binding domain-containing protein [Mangrovibacillus cuniculi]
MKATGVVRKIDQLGRVVLPMELRRTRGIEEGNPIEIFVDGESIILRKYAPVTTEKSKVISSMRALVKSEKDPNVKETLEQALVFLGKE